MSLSGSMVMQAGIARERARDRRRLLLALLVATVIHYIAILFIQVPHAVPKVFDMPAPDDVVTLHVLDDSDIDAAPEAVEADGTELQTEEELAPSAESNRTPPAILSRAPAFYPDSARIAKVSGTVSLQVVIRSDGTVGRIRVLKGLPNTGCNEAAIDAVRRSTFAPGQVDGQTVDAPLQVSFKFP